MIRLSEGTIFAQRYRVIRLIGQGGMGSVFEVVHVETERRCALKVMLPHMVDNDALRARFRQESKVAALVKSEHIVDVYDAGIDDATKMPFLVMELLTGIELRQELKTQGRLRPEIVALYLYQTALALEKTHRSNIIHRDLKPENLFLTFRENGAPHIKILDFGVAKFMTEPGTQTSPTRDVGTPLYMGPEQFTMGAQPSPQTDIYAMGMMAYTLLTGVSYWADDRHLVTTMYAFALHVIKGPPEPATLRASRRGVRLPPAFDTWFARATARDPARRFPSALATVNELADALGVPRGGAENPISTSNAAIKTPIPASINATRAPLAMSAGSKKEINGRIVIAAMGFAALLILGLVVVFTKGGGASSTTTASSANAAHAIPSASAPTITVAPIIPVVTPIFEPTAPASAAAPPTKAYSSSN